MRKILFLLAILSVVFSGYAQKKVLSQCDSVALRAVQVGMVLVPERVYVQFDNSAYFLGETIWFKAYVTSGNDNRPTEVSKVLYVELVSPEGYVVKTEKYKIDDDGICVGEFYMDPLYLSGYFEIRAYTRYMLNWGSEAVFSRVFPVFDKVNGNNWEFKNMLDRRRSFAKGKRWVNEDDDNDVLMFYPEGGHLVDGLPVRVAFEVRGERGVERYDTISLFADGKLLLKAAPVHMGKGVFDFTPESGVKYVAEVLVENNKGKLKKHKKTLPEVVGKGVALQVDEVGDSIRLVVRRNYRPKGEEGIAVVYRSTLCYYSPFDKNSDADTLLLPKEGLPEGVCRAVVFDGNLPLAERMFFVEHRVPAAGDLSTVKLNVKANGDRVNAVESKPYEKVSIVVEREDNMPIEPDVDFTVAVVDKAGNVKTSWGWNMYTYMLLGSEVKGYIPDAGQYFDRKNIKRKEHLDLVMMTNGWTAYDWKKLSSQHLGGLIEAEKEITLRGKLYRSVRNRLGLSMYTKFKNIPQRYNLIRLDVAYNPDTIKTSTFRTDDEGAFMLGLKDFYGKRVVALSPRTQMRHSDFSKYRVVLDRYFSPSPRFISYWERNTGSSLMQLADDTLQRTKEYFFLDNIDVVAKKKRTAFETPPISELNLDYLEEWEYANDVSYFDGYNYSTFIDSLNNEYKTPEFHDKTSEESRAGIHDSEEELEEMRARLGSAGDVLTASDVVKSVFRRYNLTHAYWVYNVVPKGVYHKDSALVINHEYLHGINVEKMTNFKNLVITSDPKKKNIVEVGDYNAFWDFKSNAYANKGSHAIFYSGFLSPQDIVPVAGNDSIDDVFVRRVKEMYGKTYKNLMTYPKSPNYIACFIPYDEDEKEKGIVPDLSYPTSTRRYTRVQGYTESKQFYSPDYSATPPLGKDYRRTLLWNPRAKAVDGRLMVDFYNSTDCEYFDVAVEGRCGKLFYCTDDIFSAREKSVSAGDFPEGTGGVKEFGNLAQELIEKAKRAKILKDSIFWAKCKKEYVVAEIYYAQKRYSLSLPHYIELATYGYPAAFYRIGLYYLNGYSLRKKPALAFEFMKQGAEKECPQAQYELALMFRDGVGCEANDDAAVYWLEKAVESGDPCAMLELGKMYLKEGEMCDSVKGSGLLRSSAMLDNAEALYRYAVYMQAVGVANDTVLGSPHACITRSAQMKHCDAMLYLMRYEDAAGNYASAYNWARELYMQKNHYGIKYMADCSLMGRVVRRNRRLAKDLYRDAAKLGNEDAKRALKEW